MTKDDDMDMTARVLKHGYCSGYHCKGKGLPQEAHTCPYSEEIHNNTEPCNCCEICERECAMDI